MYLAIERSNVRTVPVIMAVLAITLCYCPQFMVVREIAALSLQLIYVAGRFTTDR